MFQGRSVGLKSSLRPAVSLDKFDRFYLVVWMRNIRSHNYWFIVAVLAFWFVGCDGDSIPRVTAIPESAVIPSLTGEAIAAPTQHPPKIKLGYTHHQPDGNRYLPGRGGLPGDGPLHIPLLGKPKWVVAAPLGDASIWAAILNDGTVQAFSVPGGQVKDQPISPVKLPPGMPPLLMVADGVPTLVSGVDPNSSNLTTPVVLRPSGNMAFVRSNGDLVVRTAGESTILQLNALPDARLLTDEDERLLLLTGATGSYAHGVLGDKIEAQSVTLVRTKPSVEIVWTAPLPHGDVVEGISPIWSDLDGDGIREILITVSNSSVGSRLVVLNDGGGPVAFGPAVGRGSRWRHQLAVSHFGPSGELEVVDVLTPHIGGIVEFYRLAGDTLRVSATVPGFRTHAIGSRNLDMAVAGDFDGDSRVELLVPSQSQNEIGAIRRTDEGAEVAWTLPIDGKISTNLAAVTSDSGGLALGVGREDAILLVWPAP